MQNILPTQFITDEKGRKLSVVIPFMDYQTMVEDMHDISVIKQRSKEPTVSYGKFKGMFGDGLRYQKKSRKEWK